MTTELLEFFETLGSARRQVSLLKAQVAHSERFTIGELFNLMDSTGKGAVELADLYLFLIEMEVHPSEGEMFTIFKELDTKKKGCLTPSDLSDFFSSNSTTGSSKHSSPSKSQHGYLDLVRKLFQQMIDNHGRLQAIKLKLYKESSVTELFGLLDTNQGGMLTLQDLRQFLAKQGVPQDVIVDVLCCFTERNVVVINQDCFGSLIQPFTYRYEQSDPIIQHTLVREVPSVYEKLSLGRSLSSKLGGKSTLGLNEFDLQTFLKQKATENKARREFIMEHQKARNQLMDQVLHRRGSNQIGSPLGLNKSLSTPYMHQVLDTRFGHFASAMQSPTGVLRPTLSRSPQALVDGIYPQLDFRGLLRGPKEDPEQFSFNLSQSNSRVKNGDMANLIRKQQEELEYERNRRTKLEAEMVQYKNKLKSYTQNTGFSPQILKPLNNLHPTLQLLNLTNKGSPMFRDYNRSASQFKKPRQSGKIDRRNLWAIETTGSLQGGRERLQEQLRRSRLQRQFTKFRLQKQMTQTKYLWR